MQLWVGARFIWQRRRNPSVLWRAWSWGLNFLLVLASEQQQLAPLVLWGMCQLQGILV